MKNQKGFIQIPILIAIIAGVLVLGGGAYYAGVKIAGKKVENLENLNKRVQEKLEIDALKAELENLKEAGKKTEDSTKDISPISQMKPISQPKQQIPQVTIPTPSISSTAKLTIENIAAIPSINETLFKWNTSIPSVGRITIWPTNTPTGNLIITTELGIAHEATIASIASKKYFYLIEANALGGTSVSSEQREFTTPADTVAPKISEIKITSGLNQTILKITIFADERISGSMSYRYLYSSEVGNQWESESNLVYDKETKKFVTDLEYRNPYTFTILRPSYNDNTEFEYKLLMRDASGNTVNKEGKTKVSSLAKESF